MKHARNADALPYTRCPSCGFVVPGFNQRRRPCQACLEEWMEAQGVPFLAYVMEPEPPSR